MRRSVENHNFFVIDGGGHKPSAWIEVPQTVICPSPANRSDATTFRIASSSARKALELGHRQPLLDLWSLVIGQIPPVYNALIKWGSGEVRNALRSMSSAHACFRGIKRPVGDDDQGYDVYAYVTKPSVLFKYAPSMGCVIELAKIPPDLVCVIYVRMDYPYGRHTPRNKGAPISRGVVTHWELVEADESGLLPVDHQHRYRRQMW
ncbi:hypothetical protein Rleg4DRAFT_0567 [Rhizobium leguminosarum bv. trifolii WSM2297]|uniref:Uncharacterized protein n=1 Tax=Rhizobium leguminosarum bv. trifolii WSM2297 TaxID=754762 RepID=J0VZX9_RHILT|nr:hypothetical protein Rleg4DRAFT_0567 [Rhizobium leguminosarum bv. trifolii WSM2297]